MKDDVQAFYDGLIWQPIADFERTRTDDVVLVRSYEGEALAYWGVAEGDPEEGWRHAQESLDEMRLTFEPEEFAEVNDEWRVHLMAD